MSGDCDHAVLLWVRYNNNNILIRIVCPAVVFTESENTDVFIFFGIFPERINIWTAIVSMDTRWMRRYTAEIVGAKGGGQ